MEKVLNKIVDIVNDMCDGVLCDEFDSDMFLYGYIRALVDSGQLTQNEATMLKVFFNRLVYNKVFLWKDDHVSFIYP